jgi:hypothetical protein
MGATLERAPKGIARARSLRWEAAKHECSSWNGFGVQKSIDRIADRDARGRYQRTKDTRDLARRKRRSVLDARGSDETRRRRCASPQNVF